MSKLFFVKTRRILRWKEEAGSKPYGYRWPSGRAGTARHRALTGRRAGRAVPRPCSCLANGPWHGPWAVLPCRAARWARPFSPGHAGPWPMMHTSHITVHTSQNQSFTVHTITLHSQNQSSHFFHSSQFIVHSSHFRVSQFHRKERRQT